MSYNVVLERSPDGTTWTTLTSWTSNGGTLVDWVSDAPNSTGSAITYQYRLKVNGTVSTDAVGSRRIAGIAGNR